MSCGLLSEQDCSHQQLQQWLTDKETSQVQREASLIKGKYVQRHFIISNLSRVSHSNGFESGTWRSRCYGIIYQTKWREDFFFFTVIYNLFLTHFSVLKVYNMLVQGSATLNTNADTFIILQPIKSCKHFSTLLMTQLLTLYCCLTCCTTVQNNKKKDANFYIELKQNFSIYCYHIRWLEVSEWLCWSAVSKQAQHLVPSLIVVQNVASLS